MTTTTDPPRRGRGRPSTGVPIMVRIPAEELELIDAGARARGITRADYLRQLVRHALTPPVTTTARRRHRS